MDDAATAARKRHQLRTWRRRQIPAIAEAVAKRQLRNPVGRRLRVLSVPPEVADAIDEAVAEAASGDSGDDGASMDDVDELPADAGL